MPATDKPKLRITSDKHAHVRYRGFKGEIFTDGRHFGWRAVVEGAPNLARKFWGGKEALAGLVREVDRLADIQAALVAADQFMEAGGLDILEKRLDGARSQFERLVTALHKSDSDAVGPVHALIQAARSRKAPKCIKVETRGEWVKIWPGLRISVHGKPERQGGKDHGEQVYWIGDTAEHDSYNLHYFGIIQKITAKTVTICERGEKTKRLRIERFAWRNSRSVEAKTKRNAETRHYL